MSLGCLLLLGSVPALGAAAAASTGPNLTNITTPLDVVSGHRVVTGAWKVASVTGTVDAANAALPYASCFSCESSGVAFEIVFANQVSSIQVSNRAFAKQVRCIACASVAIAEQWVVASPQQVTLNEAGWDQLAAVHRSLKALVAHRPSAAVVNRTASALAKEVQQILATDCVVGSQSAHLATRSAPAGPAPATTESTSAPAPGITVYHYSQISHA